MEGFDKYSKKWRNTVLIERNLPRKLTKEDSFILTIKKHFKVHNIKLSEPSVISLAKWIYERPFRCPSTRLINEVINKMIKNINDIPEDSDLEDFSHIQFLPYVDIMTVDRRMYGYISQAAKSLSSDYDTKIRKSMKEFLDSV